MITKLLDYLKSSWYNRQWGRFALCYLAILTAIAVAVWSVCLILNFLASKFDIIMTVGGATLVIWYCIYAKTQEKQKAAAAVKAQMGAVEQERQRMKQERTYTDICLPLYSVLCSVGDMLGFQKPEQPQRLHTLGKVVDMGTFVKYRYQILKKGEVNPATACAILQQEMDNRIQSGELGISTQKHPYKGCFYSIIQVLEVQDVGSYCHIDLAIANDEVCAFIENRELIHFEQQNSIFADTKDRVF